MIYMAENWEKGYLDSLCGALNEMDFNASVETVGGEPALIISPPDEETSSSGIKISIEHVAESSCQLQVLAQLYSDIDAKIFADIDRLAARINQFLTVGNLTVFFEGRSLFYNYALLFIEDMDPETVTALLGSAMEIMGATISKITALLDPLMNGGITVQALLDSNISIVQGGE